LSQVKKEEIMEGKIYSPVCKFAERAKQGNNRPLTGSDMAYLKAAIG